MGFIDFLKDNFWHVFPLLVAAAFALAIAIERTRALFSVYPIRDTEAFFERITDLVMAGKLNEAIAICDRYPGKPTAMVVKQALLRAHQPENVIENGISVVVGKFTEAIQKRTSFLATIANVATLLGLFGTIAGLINSFQAVGHADAQQKAALLAAGISTAMNATMLGLAIAIPCMIAFSFLINRTNHLIGNIDQAAVRTLDMLKLRFYSAGIETAARSTTGGTSLDEEDDEQDGTATKRPTKKIKE